MAAIETNLSCPTCGGPIEVEFKFVKSVVCDYCGQTNYLNPEAKLDPRGEQQTPLVDYGSILAKGARGHIRAFSFRVRGRLRYAYPGGFWDEWLVLIEGDEQSEYWLQEDEGEFTFFRREDPGEAIPAFPNLTVGESYTLGGYQGLFIREKSRATIAGGEGELPFMVLPGEQADFVDGIYKGQLISLEYLQDETEFTVGHPVDVQEIQVDYKPRTSTRQQA
jgi:hypothetical protein